MFDDKPMPDIILNGDDATGETAVRIAAYVLATGDPARDLAATAEENPYLFIAASELESSCIPGSPSPEVLLALPLAMCVL